MGVVYTITDTVNTNTIMTFYTKYYKSNDVYIYVKDIDNWNKYRNVNNTGRLHLYPLFVHDYSIAKIEDEIVKITGITPKYVDMPAARGNEQVEETFENDGDIRTCCVFITHVMNEEIYKRYAHVKEATDELGYDLYVLYDETKGKIDLPNVYYFNPLRLKTKYYAPSKFREAECSVFGVLEFGKDHPEYDNFWFMEYDVIYTGDWKYILSQHANDTAILTQEPFYYTPPFWAWKIFFRNVEYHSNKFVRFNIFRFPREFIARACEYYMEHNVTELYEFAYVNILHKYLAEFGLYEIEAQKYLHWSPKKIPQIHVANTLYHPVKYDKYKHTGKLSCVRC